METEELVPSFPDKELAKLASDNKTLEQFLNVQVGLNAEGIYMEPSCPICSNPFRKSAESLWIETRDAKQVRDLFREKGGPLPTNVIKNHMDFHIDQSYNELRKREYINKIVALANVNLDTLSRLELALSSISERLLSVNSTEDLTISPATLERSKAEATCKLVSSMTRLIELRASIMGEGQASGDILTINKDDFSKIFDEILVEHYTPIAREIVGKILDKFLKMSRKK